MPRRAQSNRQISRKETTVSTYRIWEHSLQREEGKSPLTDGETMKLPDRDLRKEEMAMERATRAVKHTLRAHKKNRCNLRARV